MLCPQCQASLNANQYLSVEINDCPQCNGVWLEKNILEEIIEKTHSLLNNKENENNDNVQSQTEVKSPNRKRKRSHFLSGAFDISDDW